LCNGEKTNVAKFARFFSLFACIDYLNVNNDKQSTSRPLVPFDIFVTFMNNQFLAKIAACLSWNFSNQGIIRQL